MTDRQRYSEELSGRSPSHRDPVRRPLSSADREAALERVEEARREAERRAAAAKHEADTEEATARELYPEIHAAAALLGMPPREITAVTVTEEGTLVEYVNSVPSLIVPADRPDADGRSGVMPAREYRRTPTVVEPVAVVVAEPEPVAPWQEMVDGDAVIAALRPIVEGFEAEVAALHADPRYPPTRNALRGPTEQLEAARLLVARRAAAIRVEWEEANPAPPDPAEVEQMALVFVVSRLMERATSNRERKLIESRFLDSGAGARVAFLRNPRISHEHEGDAAEQWLRSSGLDLPEVPSFEDLERDAAGAPAPLTLDELVDLDAGDAA